MHRPTVGIIALALLGGAVALCIWPLQWDGYQALLGACVRVGTVMALVWLVHPQLIRLPAWLPSVVLVAAIVVAVRPKLIFFAVPLLIFLLWLRPRQDRRR